MLALGDERQIRPARHHDVEAIGRQRLMRARRAAKVGALDVEAVPGKDPALDADLQRYERDRGRDGDADANVLGGGGRRGQRQCREQQDGTKTMNH